MSYNSTSLLQEAVFNVSPNSFAGGIWMSGNGPAADSSGNIYLATANGTWNGTDAFSDSILKFQVLTTTPASLTVLDYFTPHDQSSLDTNDVDLGSGGVMLLPDPSGISGHPHLLVEAGKSGTIYLVDRDKMGHFCSACTTSDAQIVQGCFRSSHRFMGSLPIGTVLCTSAKLTRLEILVYESIFL